MAHGRACVCRKNSDIMRVIIIIIIGDRVATEVRTLAPLRPFSFKWVPFFKQFFFSGGPAIFSGFFH